MSNSDLPVQGTADDAALSFDDGVDAIETLFGDPETDLSEEDQGHEADGEDEDEAVEASDDTDPDADDEEDQGTGEEADGSGSSGRFVSRDAKFRLDDGTVISVGDLARNNLFQRDYTRKTEELKAERQSFDRDRQRVNEIAQHLATERDLILQATQFLLPEPDRSMLDENSPNYDPHGYTVAKEHYAERVNLLQRLASQRQQVDQQTQAERDQAEGMRRHREAEALLQAAPEFKDEKVYRRFMTDAVSTMSKYGLSPEEIDRVTDHRFYLLMRDIVKFHKARSGAPKVAEDMRRKPTLQGGKRMDPKGKTSREASVRADRLRKTGSLEAGIASLMDFDL